jgi:chromosome segregation ATPase
MERVLNNELEQLEVSLADWNAKLEQLQKTINDSQMQAAQVLRQIDLHNGKLEGIRFALNALHRSKNAAEKE